MPILRPHAAQFMNGASLAWRLRRRISTAMFTSRWAWPARWPIRPILGFWWSKVHKNGRFPALDADEPPCKIWRHTYVGKTSAIGQPTRPTQPFILSGSINWVVSWSRCVPPWSGDAIWRILTKWKQDGSFHSWINVWVAGKTVWTTCHLTRSSRWSLLLECKRWTDCISFHFSILLTGVGGVLSPFLGPVSHKWIYHGVYNTWPGRHQTFSYLPGHKHN